MPEPVTASRPGMVDSPGATRRTISSGVEGLAPDQVGGEIQRASQDKRIIAERLAATYRAAQQAKMSGNHDEYNRLMDEWQSRLGERRDLETYGRNLSLTQPHDFVTAEQAAKSQAELPGMVRGARERQYREAISAAKDQPNYADIESAAAKQYLDQPVEPAVPFDPAAYTRRIFDAQKRAETASERVAPQVKARQESEKRRRSFIENEQKAAIADQQNRIQGNDADSVERQIRLTDAKFRLAQAERTARQTTPVSPRGAIDTAIPTIKKLAPEIIQGNLSEQFSNPDKRDRQIETSFKDVEASIPSLTPEERAQYATEMRSIRDSINENRSVWGRTQFADKYLKRIQGILAWLETGRPEQ